MIDVKILLEPGDVVIETHMGKPVRELVIKRVTKYQAVANHWLKFRRRLNGSVVEPVNGNRYISTRYKLKTRTDGV